MNDRKDSEIYSNPPIYSGSPGVGAPQPQAAYQMNNFPPQQQQSPYMGQQPLPGMQTQYQQTTMTTMGQPQMVSMQPQMTGQPMNMNPQMNVGMQQQPMQPMQPQSTGVMMNVVVPGMAGGTNFMNLCAQGQHARTKKYGACGIITAIVFFPIGIFALFVDVEEYCVRCGTRF